MRRMVVNQMSCWRWKRRRKMFLFCHIHTRNCTLWWGTHWKKVAAQSDHHSELLGMKWRSRYSCTSSSIIVLFYHRIASKRKYTTYKLKQSRFYASCVRVLCQLWATGERWDHSGIIGSYDEEIPFSLFFFSIGYKAVRTASHNRGQDRLGNRKGHRVDPFVGKLALGIACSWPPPVPCHSWCITRPGRTRWLN